MTTWIALLRGINLGPRRRVSMPDLRAALADAGYGEVRTYVQSGNVVLATEHADAARLEQDLEELVAGRLGVETPVLVRTRDELAVVVAHDPLEGAADDPSRYQVVFLSAPVDDATAEELLAADIAPERLAIRGRELYTWHPEGIQRSALGRLVTDRRLSVTTTARNWRTVCALLELADQG